MIMKTQCHTYVKGCLASIAVFPKNVDDDVYELNASITFDTEPNVAAPPVNV